MDAVNIQESPAQPAVWGPMAGPATSEVEIRWYRWSVNDDRFEIGLRFNRITRESRDRIDRLIKALKKSGAPPV